MRIPFADDGFASISVQLVRRSASPMLYLCLIAGLPHLLGRGPRTRVRRFLIRHCWPVAGLMLLALAVQVTTLYVVNPPNWSSNGFVHLMALGLLVTVLLLTLLSVLCLVNISQLSIRQWLMLTSASLLLYPFAALLIFGILYFLTQSSSWPGHLVLDTAVLNILVIGVPLITFLITAARAVRFLTRTLIWPLSAMDHAARQIAGGDLAVTLPASRVREVAQVAAALDRMGQELRKALERQEDLEQQRRHFVSAIAHDLRTPLFSLRGHLEGVATGVAKTPEQTERYISICIEKANMLERLVEDLFTYARLEYLDRLPDTVPLDLGTLLQSIMESFQPQAAVKGVTIMVTGPDTRSDPLIAGDRYMLTRAVENLLDNALRYTSAGGTITVRWYPEATRMVLTITDTGPGFTQEDLQHLFNPLYRSERSRNRRTGGAGLGLAIAQRMFQAHGGDLSASNIARSGAQLTGILPRTQAITSADVASRA